MALHKRRSRTEWHSLIQDYKLSGLSVAAFCAERGVAVASFYQWRKRLNPAGADHSTVEMPAFVDVSSLAPASVTCEVWQVELDLGNGMTLRLNHS